MTPTHLICPVKGCKYKYWLRNDNQKWKCPTHRISMVPVKIKNKGKELR